MAIYGRLRGQRSGALPGYYELFFLMLTSHPRPNSPLLLKDWFPLIIPLASNNNACDFSPYQWSDPILVWQCLRQAHHASGSSSLTFTRCDHRRTITKLFRDVWMVVAGANMAAAKIRLSAQGSTTSICLFAYLVPIPSIRVFCSCQKSSFFQFCPFLEHQSVKTQLQS